MFRIQWKIRSSEAGKKHDESVERAQRWPAVGRAKEEGTDVSAVCCTDVKWLMTFNGALLLDPTNPRILSSLVGGVN